MTVGTEMLPFLNVTCAECLDLGPPPDSILAIPPPPLPNFLLRAPANHTTSCGAVCDWTSTHAEFIELPVYDNRIKQRGAWLLLEWVADERSYPSKQPACPVLGGVSQVSFKLLVLGLSVREGYLTLPLPGKIRHYFTLNNCTDIEHSK
ncbi:hypothetical protein J6590_030377 [Homalodisca vitripennis]|nr:hypothetical protein J6590_030377 [Homalodisca vitripennis]